MTTTATTTKPEQSFDRARSDAFAQDLMQVLNHASIALMTSIGHRTGLFDTMAELHGPATAEDIAAKAGLNERYVREWLGAMVTGRVIEYHPALGTYRLPPEHAAWLTRAASPNNMAVTTQFVSVLGGVEDRIVDAFRNGGGAHYCHYNRFHEVMADESAQTVVAALHDHILPLVDGLCDKLGAGIDVLDVGCGAGRALCTLAEAFPNSRFTGYDLCEDAIASAEALAKQRGLTNVRFKAIDVTDSLEPAAYDLVTAFDIVHDQKAPDKVLAGIFASLRPGGTFLMQDIKASSHLENNLDHPIAPFLYTISTMHCMSVSLAQGGAGLGTCWGRELACRMLDAAGFEGVEVRELPHDIINDYFVMRKPDRG